MIRGLAPVFAKNGDYYGSAEVLYDISQIMSISKSSENEEFAIYMHKDLLKTATSFLESSSSNISNDNTNIGDFVFVNKTSDLFKSDNMNPELLVSGFDKLQLKTIGDYSYAIFPIYNFKNESEGVGVVQFNISNFNNTLNTMNRLLFILGLLSIVLVVVSVLVIIKNSLTKPINYAIDIVKDVSEETFQKVSKLNPKMK